METVLDRAGNFCWKGMRTIARLVDAVYEKGVKIYGSQKRDLEHRLQRSEDLPWWDITALLKFEWVSFGHLDQP